LQTDFIGELEKKIEALISNYNGLKKDKAQFQAETNQKNSRIQELEGENESLRKEVQSLRDSATDQQSKLGTAAEKIRELIHRLETVE
jgi:predicted  nucleic acid-binding Zn-ribbon protein